MSSSAKMRKLSVRIDADLKASFEDTLRVIGVGPTCAMRSFAFQIVLEGDTPPSIPSTSASRRAAGPR